MQGLRSAFAFSDGSLGVADRTFGWNLEDAHRFCYIDYLRDNLVCLDYLQFASLAADAQPFAFAYVAE